jgi:hypothetical protein
VRLFDVSYLSLDNNYAKIVQRAQYIFTKMHIIEPANLHISYLEICRCVGTFMVLLALRGWQAMQTQHVAISTEGVCVDNGAMVTVTIPFDFAFQ